MANRNKAILFSLVAVCFVLYQRGNIRALVVMQYKVFTKWAPACRRDTSQINYMNRLRCPINITGRHDHIIVTYVNGAWQNLTNNWLCSVEKAAVKAILVVVSLSEKICRELKVKAPGVICWEPLKDPMFHRPPNLDVSKGAVWASETYQALIKYRTATLYALLKCGRPLLHTDVDVVFLRNPLPYLQNLQETTNCGVDGCGYDIIFQRDSVDWKYLDYFGNNGWLGDWYACAGFMLLYPTSASFRFVEVIINYQKTDWNDQAGINICLHYSYQELRWMTLRTDLFPNGMMIKNGKYYHSERSVSPQRPYIQHYNWMRGQNRKIRKMKENNVWCLDWR